MARELFEAIDGFGHKPPQDELSRSMRGEMAVLRLLADERRQMLAGEISKRLEVTTSRIAAVLGSLEKKGMIIRCADPFDRRRVMVSLTQEGEAFCLEKREMAHKDVARVLMRLGEEDAKTFVSLMRRVSGIMAQECHGPGRVAQMDKEVLK